MEYVGFQPDSVYCSIHSGANNWGRGTPMTRHYYIKDVADSFHVFGLDWYPDSILGWVDGNFYFRFENAHTGSEQWPFDNPFYWILNVAIGGAWGGQRGVSDTIFPARMSVDNVRVYQWNENLVSAREALSGKETRIQGVEVVSKNNQIAFSLPGNGRYAVAVTGLDGRRIIHADITGPSYRIDTGLMARGAYCLSVSDPCGATDRRVVLAGR
jgi:beta-glucanase (GH16 family)